MLNNKYCEQEMKPPIQKQLAMW